MYVVCLLFYAIGRILFLYISYSLFVFLLFRSARKHRSERDVIYFDISWFSCSCNSALFGKYNW